MNRELQQKFFSDFTTKMAELIFKKGDDYATEADRLINFKRSSFILGEKPEKAALHQIANKIARLSELLGGKIPKNESIEDSLLDCANYVILLAMIVQDSKPSIAV